MLLKDWRQEKGWTLAKLAEELGLFGRSPSETVRRWESGESRPDADIIAKIESLTGDEVTSTDMQASRLAFLNSREFEVVEE